MRYVLVDDDERFRERLQTALERRGAAVCLASDVESAKLIIAGGGIDRAVVDLRMPGESGLQLLTWIRDTASATKTLVLTGFGSIATTQAALRAGAMGYLTKPCTVDELLAAFDEQTVPVTVPVPSVQQVAWEHIQRVLVENGGNVSRAAKLLGLDRRSLQRRLSKPPRLI